MPVNLLATPAAQLYPVPGVRWGVTEAGIRKAGRKDLSVLLLEDGASVGAVFTQTASALHRFNSAANIWPKMAAKAGAYAPC